MLPLLLLVTLVPSVASESSDDSSLTRGRRTRAAAVMKPSWLWDPSLRNYSWPNVHSYCLPCKKVNVGTCFVGGCYPFRGETDCLLTRCVCKKGFCAKEDALPGQDTCVPQMCVGGPRPAPFRRGITVNLFWWMVGAMPFPKSLDRNSMEVWHFLMTLMLRALWVPLLGIASITFTMFGFRYYQAPRIRRKVDADSPDVSPSYRLAEHILHWQSAESSPSNGKKPRCREPRRHYKLYAQGYRRPQFRHLFVACVASVALCYAGIYIRELNMTDTFDALYEAIDRFHDNGVTLKKQGHKVASTCQELEVVLEDINTSCTHDPLMVALTEASSSAFKKYYFYVQELTRVLDMLPHIASQVKHAVREKELPSLYIPLIPVMVVALLIVIIVAEVGLITSWGRLKWALGLARTFEYSSVLFGSLIMFVTLFVYAGFITAMILGSFCYDVDANVLNAIDNYVKTANTSSDVYAFAEYYIFGVGTVNPVLMYTKKARLYIDEILDVYLQFEGIVASFYPNCPPLRDIRVPAIAKEARTILQAVTTLLEPANVYPYYEGIVYDGVCTEVMHSFANFPVFTLLLGLVIFPMCAVIAHKHLVHWSYWKHSQKGLGDHLDMSSSLDEDGDQGLGSSSSSSSSSSSMSEEDGTPRSSRSKKHKQHHKKSRNHKVSHGEDEAKAREIKKTLLKQEGGLQST